MTEYLTTREAAALLGVSQKTVLRWITKGRIKDAYKLDPDGRNSPYRVSKDAIDEILKKRSK